VFGWPNISIVRQSGRPRESSPSCSESFTSTYTHIYIYLVENKDKPCQPAMPVWWWWWWHIQKEYMESSCPCICPTLDQLLYFKKNCLNQKDLMWVFKLFFLKKTSPFSWKMRDKELENHVSKSENAWFLKYWKTFKSIGCNSGQRTGWVGVYIYVNN